MVEGHFGEKDYLIKTHSLEMREFIWEFLIHLVTKIHLEEIRFLEVEIGVKKKEEDEEEEE